MKLPLKNRLDILIQEYIDVFTIKHDIEFDYWIADLTGTGAVFGDYYISFDDIRLDIDNNVDNTIFFEWYDIALELAELDKSPQINYYSYLKGYRPKS